eukprot:Plantae.Rhodophyta-Purpureofilum_apyrenoidigerum.ctg30238.p2 GENE.Plantae.Rhodophyta-Purpureofilum_apyrenoidigerum.ctg30238~~Plantae.Rhodophyta-Purpureofilum_apyrenoidigerum.ctg30238.p2  ORF type:complete len:110 (-),score=4.19 Plantae.Rhodophyta-Purpureofilum_apyrenoidigerum.ctg30238:742-1071(-)
MHPKTVFPSLLYLPLLDNIEDLVRKLLIALSSGALTNVAVHFPNRSRQNCFLSEQGRLQVNGTLRKRRWSQNPTSFMRTVEILRVIYSTVHHNVKVWPENVTAARPQHF